MALQLYRTRLDKEISFSDDFKSPDTFVTWHLAMGNGATDTYTPHQRKAFFPRKDWQFKCRQVLRKRGQAPPCPFWRTGVTGAREI